ncbi:MAG: hypothetical protein WCC57_10835 [Paracoccaceae bacterium]
MFGKLLTVMALLSAGPAAAALSGFYDSAEKIGAILASAEVADAVKQAPIGAISNTGTSASGDDEWQVRVQDCDLTVHLIAMPPEGVGMTTYRVELAGPCK